MWIILKIAWLINLTRVVGAYEPTDSIDVVKSMEVLAESYAGTYQALVQGKPITCAVTRTVFDPVSPPTVVILDVRILNTPPR